MTGIDLNLLLSVQHERTVKNDNTVQFRGTTLQLPSTRSRNHYVRCPVLVHELTKGTLAVTYQGNLVAEYTTDGELIKINKPKRKRKSTKAA